MCCSWQICLRSSGSPVPYTIKFSSRQQAQPPFPPFSQLFAFALLMLGLLIATTCCWVRDMIDVCMFVATSLSRSDFLCKAIAMHFPSPGGTGTYLTHPASIAPPAMLILCRCSILYCPVPCEVVRRQCEMRNTGAYRAVASKTNTCIVVI